MWVSKIVTLLLREAAGLKPLPMNTATDVHRKYTIDINIQNVILLRNVCDWMLAVAYPDGVVIKKCSINGCFMCYDEYFTLDDITMDCIFSSM